jgi:hypothetical protein
VFKQKIGGEEMRCNDRSVRSDPLIHGFHRTLPFAVVPGVAPDPGEQRLLGLKPEKHRSYEERSFG